MAVLVDLEEFGFEDVKDFERFENMFNNLHELYIKEKQENQALKDRWEKLKDYLNNGFDGYPDLGGAWVIKVDDVLDKIFELEKGGK